MKVFQWIGMLCLWVWFMAFYLPAGVARDLPQIQESGVIRHIGVPYANFVTGSGDGLDVELMKLFAKKIGVRYEYVPSSWPKVIGDLTGETVKADGDSIEVAGKVPRKGDVIANGFTILAWRQKIVSFSLPTFPTQVWVVARADAAVQPITPSGDLDLDILKVKSAVAKMTVFGKLDTCLDPSLYNLSETGARVRIFNHGLNDMAPAVVAGEADATLLDVPDALIALEKWSGKIKVIGPVSENQEMGVAFAKDGVLLLEAFNRFFKACKADGTYQRLVQQYYPAVFDHYPDFFK